MTNLKLLGLNTWGRHGPWAQRLPLIADGIRALDPHVIGLCEVWQDDGGNTALDIANAIGGDWHLHYVPAWQPTDASGVTSDRTEGNAILSRFPLEEREGWPLPEPTGDHGRNLVYARATTPWGALPVFVTHLSWMLHWSAPRLMQTQQIRSWIAERAPIERPSSAGPRSAAERRAGVIEKADAPTGVLPPVLIGDFNATPESDEIRFLTGLLADTYGCYLADTFAWCGEGRGITWDRKNPFTAELPLPDRRLDYIFVRGPDRWHRGEPVVARVALDQPVSGVFPSDHYAVYAELRATAK